MPASRAARTHECACCSSICDPWVIQLPYEISLTESPLRPRRRNSMRKKLSWVVAVFHPWPRCPEAAQHGRPVERVPAQHQPAFLRVGELLAYPLGDVPAEEQALDDGHQQHGTDDQAQIE